MRHEATAVKGERLGSSRRSKNMEDETGTPLELS
jgi:hypothetical protein